MTIDREVAVLKQRQTATEEHIKTLFGDIKEIKDELLQRPSWATLAVITVLSSATVGLLVTLAGK